MATNRIDILDPALLRPGRIDRKIEFPNPSESSRFDILKIHSRKMNLMRGINLKKVADKMTGASGETHPWCAFRLSQASCHYCDTQAERIMFDTVSTRYCKAACWLSYKETFRKLAPLSRRLLSLSPPCRWL